MRVESSWLFDNTRVRIWWWPSYWCVHWFEDDGRKCLALGPVEIYYGGE